MVAMTIVRRVLSKSKALIMLVKNKLTDDGTSQHNTAPAMELLQAIEVELAKREDAVNCSASSKLKKSLWNVFFQQMPSITWTDYFTILQYIQNMTFVDMDCRSAQLVDKKN